MTESQVCASIREILGKMEATEPHFSILQFLQMHEGKNLTNALAEKMKVFAKNDTIWVQRSSGMTHIVWGPYSQQKTILVAYCIVNVKIDSAWVAEHNKGWFSLLLERNKARKELLQETEKQEELAKVIVQFVKARDKLQILLKGFEVAKHEIEKKLLT